MAFINEFVPEEDIKKYKLREIWDSYHPFTKDDLNKNFRHSWTIDREKDVFVIPAIVGREELSNQTIWVVGWKGQELSATLNQYGKIDLKGGPCEKRWELVRIRKPAGCVVPDEEIVSVLKEALTTYGDWGVYNQLPNLKVAFDF